jgi:hypothetical protein
VALDFTVVDLVLDLVLGLARAFAWTGIDGRYSIATPVKKPEDDELEDMDEELARIRREADGVDIYKYRRRYRLLKAVLLGAALAGLVSIIMAMVDGKKNPCELVQHYLCQKDPNGLPCKSYAGIVDESIHEAEPMMRSNIRSQCQSKMERIKEEDGVDLK